LAAQLAGETDETLELARVERPVDQEIKKMPGVPLDRCARNARVTPGISPSVCISGQTKVIANKRPQKRPAPQIVSLILWFKSNS
jgi:hypothetical protein